MDKQTEQEIMIGLHRGDRCKWQQLYNAYAERIWKNTARLMCSHSSSVADVVQETFLAAARSAGTFNADTGSLWSWLWTIASRQIALYYRRQKPDSVLAGAKHWHLDQDGQKIDRIDKCANKPEDIIESHELIILVRYALNQIPAQYQILLLEKYVDNKPIKLIAKHMNCSESALKSKLARAREAFRKAFKKNTYLKFKE